jgi:hypothetical protein
VIERAVIISTGPALSVDVSDLKFPKAGHAIEETSPKSPTNGALHDVLEQSERQQILKALEQCNWVVAGLNGAAARLGMKRSNREFANSESHAALPNRAALHFHSVPFVSVFSFSCVPQNGHATANTAVPLWQWDLGSALSARHPITNQ